MIKLDIKSDWPERLNMMDNLRDDNSQGLRLKQELPGEGGMNGVAELSFQHMHFGPHPAFGGVGFA